MSLPQYIIKAIEILGTIAFSLSGALVGIDRGLDFFGVMVLGATTAVGGGIFRDIILGKTPPTAFEDPTFVLIAIVSALFAIVWAKKFIETITPDKLAKFMIAINVCDAMGLGIFTVIGMNTAIAMGHYDNLFLLVFIGVITGVGGGAMRDVFVGKTPMIFRKNIYATASIIGCLSYYFMLKTFSPIASMLVSASVIMIIRFFAIHFDLNLPKFGSDFFD